MASSPPHPTANSTRKPPHRAPSGLGNVASVASFRSPSPTVLSSSPVYPINLDDTLTTEDLTAELSDVKSVLELHQVDPVAAREVWKAMAKTRQEQQQRQQRSQQSRAAEATSEYSESLAGTMSSKTGQGTASRASFKPPEPTKYDEVSAVVSRRRQELADLRVSALATETSSNASPDEHARRLRRSSAYPQRVLLAMDSTVRGCNSVELQQRAQAIRHETRAMESEARKWRSTMEREAPSMGDITVVRELHLLEGELLEAQLEDLGERGAELEAVVDQQTRKHAVLLKHAVKVLGPEVIDSDVPPVMTADDLRAQLRATLADIRDSKFAREQAKQKQERLLGRADRKVQLLEEELAAKKAAAEKTAQSGHSTDDDRIAKLHARHVQRVESMTEKAIASLVESEGAHRTELSRAEVAGRKAIQADVQVARLTLQRPAVAVAAGPAFEMKQGPSDSRRRGGGGARGKQQQPAQRPKPKPDGSAPDATGPSSATPQPADATPGTPAVASPADPAAAGSTPPPPDLGPSGPKDYPNQSIPPASSWL